MMKWFNQIWYEPNAKYYPLIPFSLLYQGVVFARRLFYRLGLKKTTTFAVPLIVVGNITVGGCGKTPLVVCLVELLKQQGWHPGVVSRGYGGRAKKYPMMVTRHSDPLHVGDEPLLIAQRTQVPVVVAPKRVHAATLLLSQTNCNIIISDDGMQHYALARDIEIAVIDGARRFGNGWCLPAGPLREPKSRIEQVDFTLVNGYAQKNESQLRIQTGKFTNLNNPIIQKDSPYFIGKNLHALAGIENPQRFFSTLRHLKLKFAEHVFADHYLFKQADIKFGDDAHILMTEKDAVKCRKFATDNCWYLPISVEVDECFAKQLLKSIANLNQPI